MSRRRTWPGRSAEPFSWMVFGAGGMIGVILLPVVVLFFGLLVPLGLFGGAAGSYERVHGLLTNPIVVVLALAAVACVLWHSAHRLHYTLHDLKVHQPGWVHVAMYVVAVAIPLAGAAVVFAM